MAWAGIINRAFTADSIGTYLRSLPRPSFVKFVVVHNTGAPSLATYRGYANRKNPITDRQWLLNLEGYYRDQQKWKAGPHWFVTPNRAGILAFTPSIVPGTHSPSWNSQSIGVEMVGDYQSEPFDEGVRRNTVALLAELHLWLKLDPGTIRFHREDKATTHKTCPGKNVNKAQLIADVRARMAEITAARAASMLVSEVTVDHLDAKQIGIVDLPADTDADPVPAPLPPKAGFFKRVMQWTGGGAGLGFLGYLTDWKVVVVLIGGVLLIATAFILFMGPAKVRAWIAREAG